MVGLNVANLCARKRLSRSARLVLLAPLMAFLILVIPFVSPALADDDLATDAPISSEEPVGPIVDPGEMPSPVTVVPVEPTVAPEPVVPAQPAPAPTTQAAAPAPVVVPVAPVKTEVVQEPEAPVEEELPVEEEPVEEAVEEATVEPTPTPTPTPTSSPTIHTATSSAIPSVAAVPLKVNSNNITAATPVAAVTSRWLQAFVVVLLLAVGIAYTRFMRRGGHHLGATSADGGK